MRQEPVRGALRHVVMLVAGALGLETAQMAHGALLALSVGLILAAPTATTGLLDWLDLPRSPRRGTRRRRRARTAAPGFVIGDGESILGFIPVNTEDNILHLAIGLAGLGAGLATQRAVAAPPRGGAAAAH